MVVESRWTLELEGQLGALVEINTRSTGPEARTDTASVEIGRQGSIPASKLLKADDLLPKIAGIVLAGGAFLSVLRVDLFHLLLLHGPVKGVSALRLVWSCTTVFQPARPVYSLLSYVGAQNLKSMPHFFGSR